MGLRGPKKTYKVKAGDTLWKIANEHGVSTADLVSWNNIDNPDKIDIGMKLVVMRPS